MSTTSVDRLRVSLSEGQREILDKVWTHMLSEHTWPRSRHVRLTLGGLHGAAVLQELGGGVIRESSDYPRSERRYQLTLLGILLTNRGARYDQLLDRYFKYVCERLVNDHDLKSIEGVDAAAALSINQDECSELGILIHVGDLWNGSGRFGNGSRFAAGIPEDIEDVLGLDRPIEWVHARALRDYDPHTPVGFEERDEYLRLRHAMEERATGGAEWIDIERRLDRMERLLHEAGGPEDFQAVGHHARDLLISLAQLVHSPESQPALDGKEMSSADFKRRLESYFHHSLAGRRWPEIRAVCKATTSLAGAVLHQRPGTRTSAEFCVEATWSLARLTRITESAATERSPTDEE
ncbi:MAG TPA: hypothetical protein VJP77_04665 [Planctomycetota bacterium]|nr:hypothetical protein [Planctomycetota bacterium]